MDSAKFVYAVHKGRNPGIYLTWNECQSQVSGFAGAVFRKCRGIQSAKYFAQNGKLETEKERIKAKKVDESELKRISEFPKSEDDENDPIVVYVDGSAKKDKQGFTSGGFGVWFDEGDERNCKEAFHLPNPTNQRCELMAAIKAIELTSTKKSDLERELIICSDSRYAWNCMGMAP